jgi:type 1 glutamine amidotransferase
MDNHILLASSGLVHPSWLARQRLKRTLQTMPGYVFQQVASLEVLPQLDMFSFKAIVLYLHQQAISASALACLDEFVRRGFEILGGRFRTHGPIQTMTVYQTKSPDDVFGNIPSFQIKDELYIHELAQEMMVHFEAMHAGKPVPVVWTRRYGAGRVCYAMPGHTAESMRHPMVRHILKRGLAWVCQS